MTEKKELKDYSIQELAKEITDREETALVATAKGDIVIKGNFISILGLAEKAKFEILLMLKKIEANQKKGGIVVPTFRPPGNITRQ